MATSLVAVAVPASAGTQAPPDGSTVTQQLTSPADPSVGDSSGTTTDKPSGSATTKSSTPSSDSLGALTTPPDSCKAAFGGDPTKIATCLSDAAAAGGAPTPPPQLAAVQTFLTCAAAAKDLESGKACGTALFAGLGIPKSDCLDPVVDPILAALDKLLINQDPSALQGELSGLGTALPNELAKVQSCLNPSPADTSPPAPPAPMTTQASAPAISNPMEAVPVSATPTFTG